MSKVLPTSPSGQKPFVLLGQKHLLTTVWILFLLRYAQVIAEQHTRNNFQSLFLWIMDYFVSSLNWNITVHQCKSGSCCLFQDNFIFLFDVLEGVQLNKCKFIIVFFFFFFLIFINKLIYFQLIFDQHCRTLTLKLSTVFLGRLWLTFICIKSWSSAHSSVQHRQYSNSSRRTSPPLPWISLCSCWSLCLQQLLVKTGFYCEQIDVGRKVNS